jgi:signal transduction histidine kinase/CheY-like chemotaxis protein
MILIVDDKPENIFSLKTILELHHFEVDTAQSGEEALKKILKHHYSLIILDVQMPGMDGFEVAEAISGFSKARDIPLIFLSAVNTDKRFITKGYASGGRDYITKPVDPDILLLKVKTLYRLYQQTCALQDTQSALRREIETRQQAEQELQNRVAEQQIILESLPQIAFTAGPAGHIEFVNEHWYEYSNDPHHFPDQHPQDVPINRHWQNALQQSQPMSAEVRICRPGSDLYRYHLLRVMPVCRDGQVIKWVGTFTDIHEQKSANEILEQRVAERTAELMQMNTELEAKNADLQQFASVASHDLKEPLRKIQVFSSIVRERFLPDDQAQSASYMDRIIKASERMSGLINDLLSYSRLSASGLFRKASLSGIVTDILQDLELSIREKNALIQVDDLPEIEMIPGQIRQVFQNIISNSLKFSRRGQQPHIRIKADFTEQPDTDAPSIAGGRYCRISIEDNGIGFDEKYLDRIFTIFQRLNAREEYEGTGIGLAIAKKIISKHGGLITARSAEGAGATFILLLPVQQSPAPATVS